MFKRKKYVKELEMRLVEILADVDRNKWHVVHRPNIAALSYPSDFLLLQSSFYSCCSNNNSYSNYNETFSSNDHDNSDGEYKMLQILRNSPDIKYVVEDKRVTMQLNDQEQLGRRVSPFAFSFDHDDDDDDDDYDNNNNNNNNNTFIQHNHNHNHKRKLLGVNKLKNVPSSAEMAGAETLWKQGYTGKGVKVAVFDTGLMKSHPHFRNIVERYDWTDENSADDGVGHGSAVAGIIASANDECLGFAPDAELYIFKVFTSKQVSYTSWFLDAFNYAIFKGINILNLSIGGPDFNDLPFVEKVWEVSSNNIIIVSAIGNDGPLYGSINNPADQLDVIGVGGITNDDKIASFSSRGMSTWELPQGYGRVKPDIVTFSESVRGSMNDGVGCRSLSGTSVASPVIAGAITLLASIVPEDIRWQVLNPASVKQIITESAILLPSANMFEQGHGRLNLAKAAALIKEYIPKVSLSPSSLDVLADRKIIDDYDANEGQDDDDDDDDDYKLNKNKRDRIGNQRNFVNQQYDNNKKEQEGGEKNQVTMEENCVYMWPYCSQPLYAGGQPMIVNVTIINGISVSGVLKSQPQWIPSLSSPQIHQNFHQKDILNVSFKYSPLLWPWSGWLSVYISVVDDAKDFDGIVTGHVRVVVSTNIDTIDENDVGDDGDKNKIMESNHDNNDNEEERKEKEKENEEEEEGINVILLPVRVIVRPTPPRNKRILWDQFHSIQYPTGYWPRDSLDVKNDPLDWRADHLHTNFRDLYTALRKNDYYVEILGTSWTCVDLSKYSSLVIVDSEDKFDEAEMAKIHNDVLHNGLSLLIVADWYNLHVMEKIRFFDSNTKTWWSPLTGGANVPALNKLLGRFGIALGNGVFAGEIPIDGGSLLSSSVSFASGTSIVQFPKNGDLGFATLKDETRKYVDKSDKKSKVPILGAFDTKYLSISETDASSKAKDLPSGGDGSGDKKGDYYEKNVLELEKLELQQKDNNNNDGDGDGDDDGKNGRILIWGDSNCIDSLHMKHDCFLLFLSFLKYTSTGVISGGLKNGLNVKNISSQYLDTESGCKIPLEVNDVKLVEDFNRLSHHNRVGSDFCVGEAHVNNHERHLLALQYREPIFAKEILDNSYRYHHNGNNGILPVQDPETGEEKYVVSNAIMTVQLLIQTSLLFTAIIIVFLLYFFRVKSRKRTSTTPVHSPVMA